MLRREQAELSNQGFENKCLSSVLLTFFINHFLPLHMHDDVISLNLAASNNW